MLISEGESIESCQKCLLVKTYKWHKKSFTRYLIKKRPDVVLKIDASAAAKHKIILPWPYSELIVERRN